ncbi:hypothetical protein B0H63DRAFT_417258 [Podospora didyma]|uniref:C2 domain-containing protein n=1 Tax=Podospora didyma TaxID=330526 RepID=A0AAE0KJK7_9PEZI|nr:hypothetical protein B0H63DRAFT_417258 [Podospora didyma]
MMKSHALNGMHTAGIFSDMTVDGPQIGTLVMVIDRGRNLPNRKTIGKQDPYCAARLGKEAKKTTTDIRGGQTPKWDQELRFTVHDSPDYYQLKVSVFNDDKKTELIGESWIDLRNIIIPGGGQSDQWHGLTCRGKYAGDVRIEITFYDSRPKPEKPVIKAKKPAPAESEGAPSSAGNAAAAAAAAAAGPRSMPKRRPLPSDPVTGKAPPSPIPEPIPEPIETPPRPQPAPATSFIPSQSPLQHLEYNNPSPGASGVPRYQQQPDQYVPRAPSGEFGSPQYRTLDRGDRYSAQPDDRDYSPQHQQQPSYDRYDSRPQDSYDFPHMDERGRSIEPEDDRPPPPPAHRSRPGSNGAMNAAYQNSYDASAAKGTPPTMRRDVLRNEAHRHSASASYPGRPTYKAYDSAPAALNNTQYSNPDQPSPPRHYSYDANYDPPHRTMQATVEDVPESPDSMNNSFRRSTGRLPHTQSQPQFEHEGYDMSVSPAPLSFAARGNSGQRRHSNNPTIPEQHIYQGNGYMTSPIDIGERDTSHHQVPGNFARHSETSLVSYSSQRDQGALTYRSELDDTSNGYGVPPPIPPSLVPGIDPNAFSQERNHQRRYTQPASTETPPRGRTMSDLPRRYDQDNALTSYNAPPPAQSRSPITYTGGPSTSSVNVVYKTRAYSPNPPHRDPSPNPSPIPSPNPNHTIRRKSVSPAPPPSDHRQTSSIPFGPDSYNDLNPRAASAAIRDPAVNRPDYDESKGKIITHDGREVDPSDHLPMETWAPEPEPKKPTSSAPSSGRTSFSGTQPLPPPGRRPLRVAGRPQPMLPSSGVQYGDHQMMEPATPSPPASTRNRLQKKSNRPSMGASGPPPPMMSGANGPGGFNRSSGAGVDSYSGGASPSPLMPHSPHQDNNYTPPRQMARASTFDYAGGENYPPPTMYGSMGGRGAPPIPAKVPLALPAPPGPMGGEMQLHSSSVARREYQEGGGAGYDWNDGDRGSGEREDMWGQASSLSIEEEMQRIDIGTGRSRRRGY